MITKTQRTAHCSTSHPHHHRPRSTSAPATLAVLVVAATVLASTAWAANFVVTSTVDAIDAAIGDGACDSGGGDCTLRAAVMEANSLGGSHTINVPAGTFTLALTGRNEDMAYSGDLDIRTATDIVGAGAGSTTIRGGPDAASGVDRIFHIHEVPFQLSGVTVSNGKLVDGGAAGDGGGILDNGELTLTGVRIQNCIATGAGGGVQITGTATATIAETLIDGNTASDGGGVGVAGGGTAHVSNVTISGNTATVSLGGGVTVGSGGTIHLANATIADNQTDGFLGGGISNAGAVNLKNSIVTANTNQGGGSGNCGGAVAVVSQGYNIDDGTSCAFSGAGDRSSTDPQIAALAANGGDTPTHALASTSPAVDGGNPGGCTTAQGGAMTTDQRGSARPVDGDENGSVLCDIGAFELFPAGAARIFDDDFESGTPSEWSASVP